MTSIIHGIYEVRMAVNRYNDTVTIRRIYNINTKIVYIGNYFIPTRKMYDKFLDDLDKDTLPHNFRIYKKPEDKMSEDEIKRILEIE